jgi:uncharacterized protein YndB with AHSA1/START domain
MLTPLTLSLDGDRRVIVTRRFKAPPEAVFRAHVDANLIPRWMTGPEGWSMPLCQSDARPGGNFRFEWTDGKGTGFHATGEYLAVEPHARILHVERMFLPDPTPENHVETLFQPDGQGGTRLVMTMTLPDEASRQAMLASGMADGLEDSYARIDGL